MHARLMKVDEKYDTYNTVQPHGRFITRKYEICWSFSACLKPPEFPVQTY